MSMPLNNTTHTMEIGSQIIKLENNPYTVVGGLYIPAGVHLINE